MPIISSTVGASGRTYAFKSLIQERANIGRVWLASSTSVVPGVDLPRPVQKSYILKDVPASIFSNFKDIIQPQLPASRNIRVPTDQITDQHTLVYDYLTDDFFSLVKEGIALEAKKTILKAALKGLADLHAHHVVHLGEHHHLATRRR